jgi:hypothetical protein
VARKSALSAEQRLILANFVEATLLFVIEALHIVFMTARTKVDVDGDRDMNFWGLCLSNAYGTTLNRHQRFDSLGVKKPMLFVRALTFSPVLTWSALLILLSSMQKSTLSMHSIYFKSIWHWQAIRRRQNGWLPKAS